MAEVMLALGEYKFSADTAEYQTLSRQTAWRWAKLNRLNRKPARQYQGPDTDTITIKGVIYPESARDLQQLPAMRTQADKGEPLRVVACLPDGSGRDQGLWCIEGLDYDESALLGNGVPLKIEFTLTLSEYGDDAL